MLLTQPQQTWKRPDTKEDFHRGDTQRAVFSMSAILAILAILAIYLWHPRHSIRPRANVNRAGLCECG